MMVLSKKSIQKFWSKGSRAIKDECGGSFHDVVSYANSHLKYLFELIDEQQKQIDKLTACCEYMTIVNGICMSCEKRRD